MQSTRIRNIFLKTFLLMIFLLFPLLGRATGVFTEAFLVEDKNKMDHQRGVVIRRTCASCCGPSRTIYRINDGIFDQFFPRSPLTAPDNSDLSGQLMHVGPIKTFGTATLIDMTLNAGVLRVIGVTALHNFVGFNSLKMFQLAPQYNVKFYIGRKYNPGQADFFGEVPIDTIRVSSVLRDICLFEGVFFCNTQHPTLNTDQAFYAFFSPKLPTFTVNGTQGGPVSITMHHYPLGKTDQRTNQGQASNDGRHKVRSLGGSSGAALFGVGAVILGIHTGSEKSQVDPDNVVEYAQGNGSIRRNIHFTKSNLFEIVSSQDITLLRSGANLYDGTLSIQFRQALSDFVHKNGWKLY